MKTVWICLALGMTFLLGACSDAEQTEPTVSKGARVEDNSRVPDSQIDSLRVMRIRYNITRDEYWSEYGGVLGNESFEVWYPVGNTSIIHGMAAIKRLEEARAQAAPIFGTTPAPQLKVVCSRSLPWYEKNTGQTWWHYSRLTAEQITFQPMLMLFQRGLIDIAVGKEYFRWIARVRSNGHAPMWIEYGMAAVLSNEKKIVEDQMGEFSDGPIAIDIATIETDLTAEKDKRATRIANYNAFRMVERIVAEHGEEKFGEMVVALGKKNDLDAASQTAFDMSYETLIQTAMKWKEEKSE